MGDRGIMELCFDNLGEVLLKVVILDCRIEACSNLIRRSRIQWIFFSSTSL